MKMSIESMRIDIDGKKYELRIAGRDDNTNTCSLCAFYDIKARCPRIYENSSDIYPCSCKEANFRGYWVEVK